MKRRFAEAAVVGLAVAGVYRYFYKKYLGKLEIEAEKSFVAETEDNGEEARGDSDATAKQKSNTAAMEE